MASRHETEPIAVFIGGEPFVGKSHYVQHLKLGDQKFQTSLQLPVTTAPGAETLPHHPLPAEDATVDVRLWDTPGQTKFDAILPTLLRSVEVVILVFSLENRASFESLRDRWPVNKAHCQRDPVVVLIGNKVDVVERDVKQRCVALESARDFAVNVLGAVAYYELSATRMSVRQLRLPLDIALGSIIQRRRKREQQKIIMDRMSPTYVPPPPLSPSIILGVTPSANPLWSLDEAGGDENQKKKTTCCS